MPLYEYECIECGIFSAFRKMSESALPANCSNCGISGERILSAPRFALIDSTRRMVHERNEKSAHEPRSMRRSSCGCTAKHTCQSSADQSKAANAKNSKQDTQVSSYQMQTKKTARPWMLGH